METQLQVQPKELVKPQRTIKDLLQSDELKVAVQAALPRHLKVDRFIRVALNATMRQPELLNCSRESFFRCLLDLSAYGIEADGRRAHLIPFKNNKTGQIDAQLIIDYKGLAELVRRSGDVSYIHADTVYQNDEWDFAFGSNAFLKHKPALDDRGKNVIAAYSFVKLKDGSEDFIVLGPAEIEKVRRRSKAGDSGPWKTDWDEMAKKTAFRRHSKWLPLSPEVRDAVERDDEISGVEVNAADVMKAAISIDQVKASTDANRGHDATMPSGDDIPTYAKWTDAMVPDPFDAPEGTVIRVDGRLYRPNKELTGWELVEESVARSS